MIRRFAAAAIAGCTLAWLSLQCGGKLQYGYFDSDGGLHAPDGAFLWGPGSSCNGYDASALASTSGEWEKDIVGTSIPCDADAVCRSELPAGLSTPAGGTASEDFYRLNCSSSGTCLANSALNIACPSADDEGNAYCAAFYQQFVAAPGAHALAQCRPHSEVVVNPNAQYAWDYVCAPTCCAPSGFCVERNGTPSCEYPCQP